jgi:hypothetical protein
MLSHFALLLVVFSLNGAAYLASPSSSLRARLSPLFRSQRFLRRIPPKLLGWPKACIFLRNAPKSKLPIVRPCRACSEAPIAATATPFKSLNCSPETWARRVMLSQHVAHSTSPASQKRLQISHKSTTHLSCFLPLRLFLALRRFVSLPLMLLRCGFLLLMLLFCRGFTLFPRFLVLCVSKRQCFRGQEQNCCADTASSFHLSVFLLTRVVC